jgi:hypothetical protein
VSPLDIESDPSYPSRSVRGSPKRASALGSWKAVIAEMRSSASVRTMTPAADAAG